MTRVAGRRFVEKHDPASLPTQRRGFAREYGVNFPKSRQALRDHLPEALADADND
jgi:hypothetical protein